MEVRNASISYFRYNLTSRERVPVKDLTSMQPQANRLLAESSLSGCLQSLPRSSAGLTVCIALLMVVCLRNSPSQKELETPRQCEPASDAQQSTDDEQSP